MIYKIGNDVAYQSDMQFRALQLRCQNILIHRKLSLEPHIRLVSVVCGIRQPDAGVEAVDTYLYFGSSFHQLGGALQGQQACSACHPELNDGTCARY